MRIPGFFKRLFRLGIFIPFENGQKVIVRVEWGNSWIETTYKNGEVHHSSAGGGSGGGRRGNIGKIILGEVE